MKLKTKIVLAQAPLVAALCIVALVCSLAALQIGEKPSLILVENFRSIKAMEALREQIDTEIPKLKELEHWLRLQENNITETKEEEATHILRKTVETWLRAQEGSSERQTAKLKVRAAIQRILDLNHDAITIKSEKARQTSGQAISWMIFITAAACAIGLFVTTTLTGRILRPLSVLNQAVRRIGMGDFGAHVRLKGTDEVAELAGEINAMAEHLERYKNSSIGELIEAQQAAQAAINGLPDPVLVYQIDGHVILANQAARTLKDMSLELISALEQVRSHVLSGKGAFFSQDFETAAQVSGPEGERWLLPQAAPLYGPKGSVKGVTVWLQDVTRLRRFAQFKTDLVATAAHEFRTPLTSLRMAIHLCLEGIVGPLNEKQLDLLMAARADCERLHSLVEELLHLARLEGGAEKFQPQPVSTSELLKKTFEDHKQAALDRNITLLPEGSPSDLVILADPERIHHVFDNLLDNALQHTPSGGRIQIREVIEEQCVRFEIEDTGAGIPEDLQARVFDRFFSLPGANRQGTGLGLAIAKEIILEHGGEIGVKSQPGLGSLFWFTLPQAKSS